MPPFSAQCPICRAPWRTSGCLLHQRQWHLYRIIGFACWSYDIEYGREQYDRYYRHEYVYRRHRGESISPDCACGFMAHAFRWDDRVHVEDFVAPPFGPGGHIIMGAMYGRISRVLRRIDCLRGAGVSGNFAVSNRDAVSFTCFCTGEVCNAQTQARWLSAEPSRSSGLVRTSMSATQRCWHRSGSPARQPTPSGLRSLACGSPVRARTPSVWDPHSDAGKMKPTNETTGTCDRMPVESKPNLSTD